MTSAVGKRNGIPKATGAAENLVGLRKITEGQGGCYTEGERKRGRG